MQRPTQRKAVKLLLGLLLSALSLPALAGPAFAQQPSQAQIGAVRQSCRSDYPSVCSGVPTGGSAALQCLQGHMASLSPACQSAVGAIGAPAPAAQSQPSHGQTAPPPAMSPREEAAIMRRSCGGDFRAYCQGVRLGGGRAMACLAQNQSRLSPSCKAALAQAHGQR
ncbi:hypothetical protein [Rhodopila sp.]|uniref:hypothetical protein n=1 Tax=Rhodopila sp. TaxID=2480087 RepID=UPI003D1146A9